MGVNHMRMDLESRKLSIIDTTMKVASEVGLDVLTVNQVAKRAGISEALIFKYFISKEQLLRECYYAVSQQYLDYANQLEPLSTDDRQEAEKYIHGFWEKMFNYLVELDYRTIYFMRFRETKYFNEIEEESRIFFRDGLQKFMSFFREMDQLFHMNWEETGKLTMLYGIGLSAIFLKRIIRGGIENNQENRDMIWALIWRGMSGGLA